MSASLVVQTSFIGDVILTTPLIAALAQRGPVDVVTTPAGAAVLANNPDVRALVVYDKRGRDRGAFGFVRTAMRIADVASNAAIADAAHPGTPFGARAGRAFGSLMKGTGAGSPAYLCQGSVRSLALARAANHSPCIGFSTSAAARLYTTRIEYRDDWHHARRLLSLADFGAAEHATDEALRPRLYPSTDDTAAVDALVGPRTRPLVAIAPGSVWATKRWPYYAELGQRLVEHYDVAIIGAAGDAATLGTFATDARIDSRIIDATGKLSLLGSAALIGRASAIVTNDSSPQHLASAMGTPTVTVFGPTVPEFGFGPLAPRSATVGRTDLACRPCDRHGPNRCPLGHWRCMRDVRVETVLHRVTTVIHQDTTP